MKGAPRKKQYHFFFSGAPKITKINYFCTCSLGRSRHMVMTNQNKVLHFKIPGCFISKLLYTMTLVLPRSTWNFKKSDLNTFTLSKQLQNKIKKQNKNSTSFEIATYRIFHKPFRGAPKISKIYGFYRSILCEQW